MKWTQSQQSEQVERLFDSCCRVLTDCIVRLRDETGDRFPEKGTAFHRPMVVHGKFAEPCPVCATPVQRVVFADREFNYSPGCQTGGRILKDRSLSRLLKDAWPDTIDDL